MECPLGFEKIDSNCYFFSIKKLNWEDARQVCAQIETNLIVPSTNKDIDYLRSLNESIWTGANDQLNGKVSNFKL